MFNSTLSTITLQYYKYYYLVAVAVAGM